MLPPARPSNAAGGWNFFGAAMRNSKSSFAAAKIQEAGTLHAPSPINATLLPADRPAFFLVGENVGQ